MSTASNRYSLAFSSIGHAYAHLFEPIFYIVALVLPGELGLPYEETLALIIGGKLLFGLAAPLAGWLGDRWSTVGMMAVYFLGLGASAVLVGLASSPVQMAVALTLLGLFGSIYHPVGIAWLVRSAVNRGKALGVNGVFGGLGPAVAGVTAGVLIETLGWRSAFVIPGAVVLVTGAAFLVLLARGMVVEVKTDHQPQPPASRADALRAGIILSVTMLCGGLVYQATQPALPKLFEARLDDIGVFGVGGAVMTVYLIAGLSQVLSGHLADRYPLKLVYVGAYIAQIPLLLLAASLSGLPLVLVAVMMVSFNMAGIPAENVLLARYAPAKWRGTAFGMKFVLSFGVSGLGVPLVSVIHGATGGLYWLFVMLAGMAAIVAAAGMFLPAESAAEGKPATAPAE
ncbi:MAG: MFS transporter [Rhodospirillales bacterium]|nr:MFS transporter [Rhodospirillales bacterium]